MNVNVARYRSLILAVAAILIAAAPLVAQDGGRGRRGGPGGGGFGQFFQPEYLRRDLTLFSRELELEEAQNGILETLLYDYEAEFTDAAEALREEMSALRPERAGDEEAREERRAVRDEMREVARSMRSLRSEADPDADPAAIEEKMEALRVQFEGLRQKMDELRPNIPQGEQTERWAEMTKLFERWRGKQKALEAEFLANVQAMLQEDQVENWPTFERTMRRAKRLPAGRISGERTDLYQVVREFDASEAEQVRLDVLLDDYAIMLDTALVVRDDFMESARIETMTAMFGGDTETAVGILQRERTFRTAVRDVNDEYAEILASELEPQRGASMRGLYRSNAYARVFRPTRMQRAFEIVHDFENVDDETRTALIDLEAAYMSELQESNEALLRLTREEEPKQNEQRLLRRMERMQGDDARGPGGGGWGDRPPDPIREGYEKRSELDRSYRTQLEAMLTPEQLAALPDMPVRVEGGRRDGPGGEQFEERRRRMMERYDRDGDGELNEEERREAREARGDGARGGGRRGPE